MQLLPDADLDKLRKLCGLFSSEHAGERATAAAMADAFLRSRGLRWTDVLHHVPRPPVADDDPLFADWPGGWRAACSFVLCHARLLSGLGAGVLHQDCELRRQRQRQAEAHPARDGRSRDRRRGEAMMGLDPVTKHLRWGGKENRPRAFPALRAVSDQLAAEGNGGDAFLAYAPASPQAQRQPDNEGLSWRRRNTICR
jgi:hypothetical protein